MRSFFAYHRPDSVAEAVALKNELGAEAVYWAGGTDLQLLWSRGAIRIEHAIDITHLPLRGIDERDGLLSVGALTTLADLERAGDLGPECVALAAISRVMCTPQTRTLGTIGGSICHASPSGDLAPTLLTLDATVELVGSGGSRSLPLSEFFLHVNKTAKDADELVTGFTVPVVERRRSTHARIARTAVDIALCLAAASLTLDESGEIDAVRIALGSVAPTPIRAPEAESALVRLRLSDLTGEALEDVAATAATSALAISDIRASKGFREETARVLVRRALEGAAAAFSEDEVLV